MPESIGKDAPVTAVAFRGGGFEPGVRRWAPWAAFAAILLGWQAASSTGVLPELLMPSPLQVLAALKQLVLSGTLPQNVGWSLQRILLGWVIGTACGLGIGLAMGMFSLARAVGIPVVAALFPIPKIALLPLFILWFGIGEPSKVAVIALGVFFPTTISAYSAVDGVSRSLIRMAQSFGVPAVQIVRKVIVPAAMPGILAGFRISTSIALILLVAAEMIGATYGIGAFVLAAGNLMQTDQLVAGVVLLSLLGLGISSVLGRLEKWLLRWR
jgi:ABC-type nitrate/sulfonate/bicarbonate transport system permease component